MNIKNKKILITGGAGFIGSNIAESLLKKGARVTIYDNFSSGYLDNIISFKKEIEIIRGDILDYKKFTKVVKRKDIISHQAAHLEILKALNNPSEDLTNNTMGTLNVLRAARGQVEKIVIASSACVYGQAKYVPSDENHPKEPNWEYGISKLAAEKYSNIYAERHAMNIVNLRYSIVYGPREWYGRVLTIFLKRAMEGKPLVVFGKGNQERDFVYVSDIVNLHNKCIENNLKTPEVFNAATGIATSISKLAKIVKKVSGKNIDIIYDDIKEGEVSKYNNRIRLVSELRQMVLDNRKAKKTLSWAPEVNLEEGIANEYEWLIENNNRWTKMSV